MDTIFLTILNMTFTASFVIIAIIAVRFFLKKTPKIISYILWAAAGFRLIFPFSIESVLSLIPFKSQPIPQDITAQAVPRIDTGIIAIDNAVNNLLPGGSSNINPLQIWTFIGAFVWIMGIAAMLIYSISSIILLKRKLDDAYLIEDNIYETSDIKTPFVFGLFKPKIFIPADLTENEKRYIILHERTHIRRFDYIIKFAAFFILSLHWFNPFVWAAFILMSADMEMSCDERVLRELNMGSETKKAYSMSLLSLAAEKHIINGSPLAFGEGSTKRRIKNVLNFKKQSKVIVTFAVIMVAALTVGFTVNRVNVDNTNLRLAADLLIDLKIITEDDVSDDNITLKDLALFTGKIRSATPEYFVRYEDAINYCIENGLFGKNYDIDSQGNVTPINIDVDPDGTITFYDAVKVYVTALGYTGLSEPNGYMSKAAEQGVWLLGEHAAFKFENTKNDKILTKNETIMLLYNFLTSNYNYLDMVWNEKDARYESRPNIQPVSLKFGFVIASPSTSKVTVDGKKSPTEISAYNIGGESYFKIRDLAYILNGTPKQFEVQWDNANGLVSIAGGKPYKSVGGEMSAHAKNAKNITAVPTKAAIHLDGESVGFQAYHINGNNYFSLETIAQAFDFSVVFDSEKNTIVIDTNKSYSPE